MTDTPAPDHTARNLAEQVYAAYARQAAGPMHPQHEQILVTRLAEAARAGLTDGPGAVVDTLNAALDVFEQAEPQIRGPRIAEADMATGTVRLAAS